MPDFPGAEIVRSDGAISIQTQQRERPSAGRAKGCRGRQCLGEQRRGPYAAVTGLASLRAVSPKAQSVRPWLSSEPVSSSQVRLKPMKLRNRRVSGFHACCTKAAKRAVKTSGNRCSPGLLRAQAKSKRPGVVVDAIAVRAIGHRMHRVLEQTGIVAH